MRRWIDRYMLLRDLSSTQLERVSSAHLRKGTCIPLCRYRYRYRYKYTHIYILWDPFWRCCETSRLLSWNGSPLHICKKVRRTYIYLDIDIYIYVYRYTNIHVIWEPISAVAQALVSSCSVRPLHTCERVCCILYILSYI